MPNVDLRSPGAWQELPPDAVQRFDAELAPILRRYPEDRKASAMIPALRIGEHVFGWLSPAVMALAADRLGVSPSRAEEVATFYVMFRTRPGGRHLVELCTNVSCCLAGADRMFEALKRKLGVENGGTTADGRITLREVECLGACGTAPAMLIDEEMEERLTPERLEKIVGDLK
ncbi:MAG TPA: NAD(P)H-dependent oxidoreductase subunit E [Anaeromyxobacteraceae bacterium]|nr:NAD(P)H-dependent oxidoreductase subunit E [Anaeromyxobacteraceae bacterium]